MIALSFTSSLAALALAAMGQQASTGQGIPAPAPQVAEPETDAPIVPDAAFDQALPPLSDTLDAPLEPMPDLPPAVPLAPLPGEGADETALAAPLPPLAGFDATPPVDVADVADGKAVEIRYATAVEGLDALGLTGQFNALSELREGGGSAPNAAIVAGRAREDEALAVRLLKSRGYYDGTAISTIETVPGAGAVRAVVRATAGKQYRLGSIAIDAGPTVPPDLIRRELPLVTGDPIEADRVQGAEANVSLKLPQQGYPFVTLGTRDILLDEATFTGAYTLPVDTGPRASFGSYTTDGELAFGAEHVGVLARFKPGELYDNRKVDDLREALIATGLFSTVSVEPVRTGKPGPDGTELVDLRVRQSAGPARSVAANAGYSTGQGVRLEGTFTHRNLFKPEGALIVNAIAGTQEQGLGVTFRRQNAGRRDRTVTLTASANHSNYDAFNAFTTTLLGKVSYDSTPIWQKRFTYAYGAELTGTNENVYDFARGARRRATYFIAALPLQAQFDTSNDLLNPVRGYRIKASFSPEASVRGAARPYVRTLVEAVGYYPVTRSIVLAGRLRAGVIAGVARDDLAPSRRYYGGGGGSVRGYGYQRLGPRDPNGDPVGGRSLNEFSLEARYRFGNFGIVPFFDGGNAYESVLPKGSDLRYGAGIGARYYTNFGPLRIDVATPLNPRPGDGRVALYLSIGQAF